MNVCIVNVDKVVMVDGVGLNFEYTLDSNIWAVQWDGSTGSVEFKDGTPNEIITDFSDYQYLVDAYNVEKARVDQAELDAIAARPYGEKRLAEYPDPGEYLDGIVKGDQAQIDKYIADCLAVKAKYPKI